jgi:hypothetical protein
LLKLVKVNLGFSLVLEVTDNHQVEVIDGIAFDVDKVLHHPHAIGDVFLRLKA